MIELPEAISLSRQISEFLIGKRIINVTAAQSPHKFAWYSGDPQKYHEMLSGKAIDGAESYGGQVAVSAGDKVIIFSDGTALRFHYENEKRPSKHQLLLEFEDFSALSVSIQMYGGILCFSKERIGNGYFQVAKEKPSPLSEEFSRDYFKSIISNLEKATLSVKALLATEQRIPGLGNGVLQDILFNARIHPKKKVLALTSDDRNRLFDSIKSTLAEMTFKGGRDTEKDIFGSNGGYMTKLSKNTANKPCPVCGAIITKEAYLGGSIYYCSVCQAL